MRVVVNLHPFNYSGLGWSEVTAQLPDNLSGIKNNFCSTCVEAEIVSYLF